jgi:hypothetical protein
VQLRLPLRLQAQQPRKLSLVLAHPLNSALHGSGPATSLLLRLRLRLSFAIARGSGQLSVGRSTSLALASRTC